MLNKFDVSELSLDEIGVIEEYIVNCINDYYQCGNYCGNCRKHKDGVWLGNNCDEILEDKFRG